jgi:Carboxypeptidase regulatory-like domain/TonB dependent receptor-like, beta-barrel
LLLAAARHDTLSPEKCDKIEKAVSTFVTPKSVPGISVAMMQEGPAGRLDADLCWPIKNLCSLYHKVGVCFPAEIAALPRKSRRYGVRLAGGVNQAKTLNVGAAMKSQLSRLGVILACALSLFFISSTVFSPPLLAQSTYGSIAGAVTDSSGAAIADAQVTLTNLGTGEKRTQTTGPDGLYSIVNLFPGRYKLEVEKTGFKRFTRPDVVVEVNQSAHIDVVMPVGDVTQTVEVTAETPLLQSETSSLGQVIDQREANELPLNGRNVFNLAELSPSVVPQGSTLGNIVGKNPFDLGNFQIGGSFANQGAEYLDGQPLNIGYINVPLVVPTQDSIGEFKVQYNNLGPEWGKFSGGVINFSTKSGTNTWHGEAYEYLRAKVLNANDPFLKASEISSGKPNEPPPYTQNQFGGTVGGPVIKQKTFVFGSYEGYRQRAGTVFTTTVPTAAERGGNFADLCKSGFTFVDPTLPAGSAPICGDVNAAGQHINQLYNPLAETSAGVRMPIANNNLAGNNPITGAPFINPTASFLLGKLIANPTGAGSVGALGGEAFNDFTKSASGGGDIDQYVVRVDHNLTASQHLFGRFTYFKELSLAQDPFGTGLCKDRCAENTHSRSVAVGWSDALSSTLTLSLNASFSRYYYIRQPINANFDVTQEGWPAAYNPLVPNGERTPMTPCFAISDPLVSCSQGQSAILDWDTQWNLSPQFTKIHGRHTFSFGLQYEQTYDNYYQTNIGGGIVSFNGSWTAPIAGGKSPVSGNDYADFLLGYGLGVGAAFGNQTTGQLAISQPTAGKEAYRGFFFGDTWKATNKLTFNLGLRYELPGTWTERHDRLDYFDPNATSLGVSGCGGAAGSPCRGDVFLVGTGINTGRSALPLNKKEWSPRFGLAYALNQKTVIRAGYGVFYIPNNLSFQGNPNNDAINDSATNFFASNNKGLAPSATLNQNGCTLAFGATPLGNTFACTGAGPFGQNVSTLIAPAGRNPIPNVSTFFVNASSPNTADYSGYKPGYVEQWNLDLQRDLPGGFFADIAYAGAHGVHLQQYTTNINQISDGLLATAAQQAAAGQPVTIAQNFTGAYPFNFNLPGSLGPGSLTVAQLNRPYPQFGGLNLYGDPCCSSRYDSLQLTVVKRFNQGGTLLVAYTNSKLLSNTDTLTSWLEGPFDGGVGSVQDWNNLKHEYSLSSQDVPQRLAINYVLDLPIGRGKRFLSDASGVEEKLVGGWGVDGVTVLQRGFPLKITDGNTLLISSLGAGVGTIRPNVVAGCDKGGSRTTAQWFNTTCFTDPAAYTFGNEGRTDATLRQDGIINFDFALFKRTYFTERMNLEFRTEFFNLFNRAQFAAPNTTFVNTGGNFGQVTAIANNPRLIQFGLKFSF